MKLQHSTMLTGLSIKSASALFSFIAAMLASKLLSKDGYGNFATALSLINIASILIILGNQHLSTKLTIEYKGNNKEEKFSAYLFYCFATTLIFLALLVVFLILPFSMATWREIGWPLVAAIIICTAFSGFLKIIVGILRGLHQSARGNFCELALRPALVCCILAIFFFQKLINLTFVDVLIVYAAAYGLCLFLSHAFISNQYHLYSPTKTSYELDWRGWFVAGVPIMISSVVIVANKNIDILMIRTIVNSAEAANYQVAARISELVAFSLAAINMSITPKIASKLAKGDLINLQQELNGFALQIAAISFALMLIIIFLAKEILGLFGSDGSYEAATGILILLATSQFINSIFGVGAAVLQMSGHQLSASKSSAVCLASNILLNIALIPHYGAFGAAVAFFTSSLIWNILIYYYSLKLTGLDPSFFFLFRRKRI